MLVSFRRCGRVCGRCSVWGIEESPHRFCAGCPPFFEVDSGACILALSQNGNDRGAELSRRGPRRLHPWYAVSRDDTPRASVTSRFTSMPWARSLPVSPGLLSGNVQLPADSGSPQSRRRQAFSLFKRYLSAALRLNMLYDHRLRGLLWVLLYGHSCAMRLIIVGNLSSVGLRSMTISISLPAVFAGFKAG